MAYKNFVPFFGPPCSMCERRKSVCFLTLVGAIYASQEYSRHWYFKFIWSEEFTRYPVDCKWGGRRHRFVEFCVPCARMSASVAFLLHLFGKDLLQYSRASQESACSGSKSRSLRATHLQRLQQRSAIIQKDSRTFHRNWSFFVVS